MFLENLIDKIKANVRKYKNKIKYKRIELKRVHFMKCLLEGLTLFLPYLNINK